MGLDLEQFEGAHGLVGRCHHAQIATRCGQHQPGRRDVEHVDAPVGEHGQQLDDVEVGDEGVGQFDERLGEHGFSCHRISCQRRSGLI